MSITVTPANQLDVYELRSRVTVTAVDGTTVTGWPAPHAIGEPIAIRVVDAATGDMRHLVEGDRVEVAA